jgi:hypothetical protein
MWRCSSENMTDKDPMNRQDALDAALAKLADVEPRAGLEQRILASLRAQRNHASTLSWWRWPSLAALLPIVVLIITLAWRSERPARTAQHPASTLLNNDRAVAHLANNRPVSPIRHRNAAPETRLHPHVVIRVTTPAGSVPKLDQFPSPQPLSEQERILAHYVMNYPQHAALIAQARTDELRRDSLEESGDATHENTQQREK